MSLPKELTLAIVTPERLVVKDTVDEVTLPGTAGELGILPGHTPLLTSLRVGPLWYRKGQQKFHVAVAHGFAEVLPDGVTVLARMAERGEEIDVQRAEAARQQAEQLLARGSADTDLERARLALSKATTRVQVATRARGKG